MTHISADEAVVNIAILIGKHGWKKKPLRQLFIIQWWWYAYRAFIKSTFVSVLKDFWTLIISDSSYMLK